MHEHNYPGKYYMLMLNYHGQIIRLRAKQYHFDARQSLWHIFSRSRVLDFTWDHKNRNLVENLVGKQKPVPDDFLELLQKEFEAMHPNS